jgi:hypothetical protein
MFCVLATRSLLGEIMPQVHPGVSISAPLGVSVSIDDDDKFCALHSNSPTIFTVWKRSLLFNGNGLTVFDSSGNLVFRVDNYSSHHRHQRFLMDAAGNVLLTIRHKVL